MLLKHLVLNLFFILLSNNLNAELDIVPVGKATFEKTKILVEATDNCECEELVKTVKDDLSLYKKFFDLEVEEATFSVRASFFKTW